MNVKKNFGHGLSMNEFQKKIGHRLPRNTEFQKNNLGIGYPRTLNFKKKKKFPSNSSIQYDTIIKEKQENRKKTQITIQWKVPEA